MHRRQRLCNQLQLPAASRIHDVFHCSLLKPASDSHELGVRGTQLPNATDSGEYEVEKILTKRGEENHIQYLIKWKGFPMEDCSWEPASNLKNSKRILAAFNNKHEIESQRRLSWFKNSIDGTNPKIAPQITA